MWGECWEFHPLFSVIQVNTDRKVDLGSCRSRHGYFEIIAAEFGVWSAFDGTGPALLMKSRMWMIAGEV